MGRPARRLLVVLCAVLVVVLARADPVTERSFQFLRRSIGTAPGAVSRTGELQRHLANVLDPYRGELDPITCDEILPEVRNVWQLCEPEQPASGAVSDFVAALLAEDDDVDAWRLAAVLMAIRPMPSRAEAETPLARLFARTLPPGLRTGRWRLSRWLLPLYGRILAQSDPPADALTVLFEQIVMKAIDETDGQIPFLFDDQRALWAACLRLCPLRDVLALSQRSSVTLRPATWAALFLGVAERLYGERRWAIWKSAEGLWRECVADCQSDANVSEALHSAMMVRLAFGEDWTRFDRAVVSMLLLSGKPWLLSPFRPDRWVSSAFVRRGFYGLVATGDVSIADFVDGLGPMLIGRFVDYMASLERSILARGRALDQTWFKLTGPLHLELAQRPDLSHAYNQLSTPDDYQRVAVALYFQMHQLHKLELTSTITRTAIGSLLSTTRNDYQSSSSMRNALFRIAIGGVDSEPLLTQVVHHPLLSTDPLNIDALDQAIERLSVVQVDRNRFLKQLLDLDWPYGKTPESDSRFQRFLLKLFWQWTSQPDAREQSQIDRGVNLRHFHNSVMDTIVIEEDHVCPICQENFVQKGISDDSSVMALAKPRPVCQPVCGHLYHRLCAAYLEAFTSPIKCIICSRLLENDIAP